MTYDAFVSHNRRQKPWVREFCKLLRSCGLNVFFDEDSLEPGSNVITAIDDAIRASRAVVLIITPSALSSHWVAAETTAALYQDPDGSRRRLIPVLLEPVEEAAVPGFLQRLNRVDLANVDRRNTELARLLMSLGVPVSGLPRDPQWLMVADREDVQSWGWTGDRLLDELIKLDYETVADLTPEHEGLTAGWAPVFMNHPDTWRLLVNGPGNVVGYWHYVPLFAEEFALAKAGKLYDGEITEDRIPVFEFGGFFDIYFVTMVIAPRMRSMSSRRLLLSSFVDVMQALAQQDVFFREVCANAFTADGVSLCRSFEMEPIGHHVTHGCMYSRRLFPFPRLRLFEDRLDLVAVYDRAFKAIPHDSGGLGS